MTYSTITSPGVSLQGGGGSGGGGASLPLIGTGATVTASAPLLDLSQTWNNAAVTFTGLKANFTDTASNSSSLLLDLQRSGTRKFAIDKDGAISKGSVSGVDGVFIRLTTHAGGLKYNTPAGVPALDVNATTDSFAVTGAQLRGDGQLILSDVTLSRRAAANLRLGTADAASPVAQTLSVQSVVAGTTNTAGANFTITGSQGTGSGAGGSIIFQVAPAGASGTAQNALATALTIDSSRNITIGGDVVFSSGASLKLGISGLPVAGVGVNYFALTVDTALRWTSSSTTDPSATADLVLRRDAANTLALRNGTNPQAFNVYNTYTDASNYELGFVRWSSNEFQIGTGKAGTGTLRNLSLLSQGSTALFLGGNSAIFSRNITFNTDNAYDIGATSASRPRDVFAARSITPGAGVAVASLPTPSTGMIARVTDASAPTVGSTVTGGGSAAALVWYNGANWTVIGV